MNLRWQLGFNRSFFPFSGLCLCPCFCLCLCPCFCLCLCLSSLSIIFVIVSVSVFVPLLAVVVVCVPVSVFVLFPFPLSLSLSLMECINHADNHNQVWFKHVPTPNFLLADSFPVHTAQTTQKLLLQVPPKRFQRWHSSGFRYI